MAYHAELFLQRLCLYPLGGNRVSLPRQILNLFIVWGLTDFGTARAGTSSYGGSTISCSCALKSLCSKKFIDKIPKIIRWVYSMFVVLIGWMIFYFEDFLGDEIGVPWRSALRATRSPTRS